LTRINEASAATCALSQTLLEAFSYGSPMFRPPDSLRLSIPRLIQRIIDQGINAQNQEVVVHTGLLMLGISHLSMAMAVGNNILSIKVGESVASDEECMQAAKLADADLLLVINDGRIVERGTHRQLLLQGGVYYQLYISQFRGHKI
jgi:hypothetical protein